MAELQSRSIRPCSTQATPFLSEPLCPFKMGVRRKQTKRAEENKLINTVSSLELLASFCCWSSRKESIYSGVPGSQQDPGRVRQNVGLKGVQGKERSPGRSEGLA